MDKQESQSFGMVIWEARRKKRFSQRELAVKVGVDYTYLSKLENDHVQPSEKVIRSLAEHLDLNPENLVYLAGRMTQDDSEALEELVKTNYKEMSALFRRVRENPGIDSLVEGVDDQVAELQKENATLKAKIFDLEKQLRKYRFYSKAEIERSANNLLRKMEINHFPHRWPLDVNRVADFLELTIYFDKIQPDNKGPIVAKVLPLERTIIINVEDVNIPEKKSRIPEKFSSLIMAHEIGHWILHVNQDESEKYLEGIQFNFSAKKAAQPFLCRLASDQLDQYSLNSQWHELEWQAQYFASCLLMPKHILEEKRKGRDLTKWLHLYAMRDELGVTISNLVNRLQDIGWIYIPKGSKQIYLGKLPSSNN